MTQLRDEPASSGTPAIAPALGAKAGDFEVLDLFCGAGGAAMGIHRALVSANIPHKITGVDIVNQPRYPFCFRLANAMHYPLENFDFIWASPPCQGYSIMRNLPWLRKKVYPLLIAGTQKRLRDSGIPFCIENVQGAKREMDANWLCGTMFGLPFYRHRMMETSFMWLAPGHRSHQFTVRNGRMRGARARDIVFSDSEDTRGKESWPGRRGEAGHGLTLDRGKELTRKIPKEFAGHSPMPVQHAGSVVFPQNGARKTGAGYGHAAGISEVRKAMQIDWMTREEITQAVPPAYSEFIFRQFLAQRRECTA